MNDLLNFKSSNLACHLFNRLGVRMWDLTQQANHTFAFIVPLDDNSNSMLCKTDYNFFTAWTGREIIGLMKKNTSHGDSLRETS